MHYSQPTLYRTSQFHALAQPSLSAVHLTANVNTNGNIVLCIITWALDTGELLGHASTALSPVKASTYQPTLCVEPRANPDVFEGTENNIPYRNSNPGIVQTTASSVDRLHDLFQEISSSEGW